MLRLLEGAATEAELISDAQAVFPFDQSTGNRRLSLLQRKGMIVREAGRLKAPGRRWTANLPQETGALLHAALTLSAALADQELQQREAARRTAARARASHLRDAGGAGGTPTPAPESPE